MDVEVLDVGVPDPDPVMDEEGVATLTKSFGRGVVSNVRLTGKGHTLKELTGKGN